MIAVTLPWPDPKLNPNRSKGAHWASTSQLRKEARETAWARTLIAACKVPLMRADTIPLTVTFIQPDRRARDRDNLLAALKPSLDGVADALGVNDAQFDPVTIRREYGGKPGAVRIEIGAAA
jgi:crossover junction endodeoxyribonuclease RusA